MKKIHTYLTHLRVNTESSELISALNLQFNIKKINWSPFSPLHLRMTSAKIGALKANFNRVVRNSHGKISIPDPVNST
jgi:hypothetical protein